MSEIAEWNKPGQAGRKRTEWASERRRKAERQQKWKSKRAKSSGAIRCVIHRTVVEKTTSKRQVLQCAHFAIAMQSNTRNTVELEWNDTNCGYEITGNGKNNGNATTGNSHGNQSKSNYMWWKKWFILRNEIAHIHTCTAFSKQMAHIKFHCTALYDAYTLYKLIRQQTIGCFRFFSFFSPFGRSVIKFHVDASHINFDLSIVQSELIQIGLSKTVKQAESDKI